MSKVETGRETTLHQGEKQALRQSEDRWAQRPATLMPPVDIHEDDEAVHVVADMPGVSRDGLRVEVVDQMLEIEGDIALEMPEGVSATFAEVRASRYHRRFSLGQAVDRDAIEASIRDGVLRVRLPKADAYRRRRIEISAA